jgi:hypothetical protein
MRSKAATIFFCSFLYIHCHAHGLLTRTLLLYPEGEARHPTYTQLVNFWPNNSTSINYLHVLCCWMSLPTQFEHSSISVPHAALRISTDKFKKWYSKQFKNYSPRQFHFIYDLLNHAFSLIYSMKWQYFTYWIRVWKKVQCRILRHCSCLWSYRYKNKPQNLTHGTPFTFKFAVFLVRSLQYFRPFAFKEKIVACITTFLNVQTTC